MMNTMASSSSSITHTTPKMGSLSPTKNAVQGLVKRPSINKHSGRSVTSPEAKRRSGIHGAGGLTVDSVKSPGELTVFVSAAL